MPSHTPPRKCDQQKGRPEAALFNISFAARSGRFGHLLLRIATAGEECRRCCTEQQDHRWGWNVSTACAATGAARIAGTVRRTAT
jgi:hypothetical protein